MSYRYRQALLTLCALAAAPLLPAQEPDYPDVITAERGGFTPEGIEYDHKHQRFLLGSVVEGRIYTMDADGNLSVLVDDPDLDAVVGIEVEEERNRILAVNADASVFSSDSSGAAAVGVYDLDSGERIAMVDLDAAYTDAPEGTRFFPNDVVADEAGNIYVTDSFAVVVYKVDTDFNASVFVSRDQFPEDESLNGIESHPDGYLLVAGPGTGVLYRVAVTDASLVAPVGTSERLPGADGMVWAGDDTLAVVDRGRTVLVRSQDNWTSARIVEQAEQGPASTIAAVGEELYLVYPHFADQDPPTVEKVTFTDQ